MTLWKQFKCTILHMWAWVFAPTGMHRYSYECLRCGRKWDVYE